MPSFDLNISSIWKIMALKENIFGMDSQKGKKFELSTSTTFPYRKSNMIIQ